MTMLKRLFIGMLYAIPFVAIHLLLALLAFKDPHTLIVLKRVGYIALGVYTAIWGVLGVALILTSGLMAIRYFFGIRIKAQIKETE